MTHRILSRLFQIGFLLSVSLDYFVKSTLELRILTFHDWNFNSGNYLFTTDTK